MRIQNTRAQPTPYPIPEVHGETTDLVTSLFRVFAERREPVARVKYLLNRLLQWMEEHAADYEARRRPTEPDGRKPDETQAVQILRQEHAELIERLRQLVDLIDNGNLEPEDWERLERDFREFGTRWCQHHWYETAYG